MAQTLKMETTKSYYFLCKCNKCDAILLDENPQVGAQVYELTGNELDMLWNNEENAWVCPNCDSDDYLTDL